MLTRLTFEEESGMIVTDYPHKTCITIEKNTSDMTLTQMIDLFIIPMLKSIGYADETVDEYFREV